MLLQTISSLEKDIAGLKKEIGERDETIGDKEKRIYDLKKKNQVGSFSPVPGWYVLHSWSAVSCIASALSCPALPCPDHSCQEGPTTECDFVFNCCINAISIANPNSYTKRICLPTMSVSSLAVSSSWCAHVGDFILFFIQGSSHQC